MTAFRNSSLVLAVLTISLLVGGCGSGGDSGSPGQGSTMVTIPNVVGTTEANARAAIVAAGLTVGNVTLASSPTVPSGNVISQTPPAGTSVAASSAVNIIVSTGPIQNSLATPNVVGSTEAAARALIAAAQLLVGTVTQASSDTVPAGSVISQNPAAGTQVLPGASVDFVVSTGPVRISLATPNVVGSTEAAARALIAAAQLLVGTVTQASSDTVPAGSVISQDPTAGTQVLQGASVDFVVSTGPAQIRVPAPNLVGMTEANARDAIVAASLVVGAVTHVASSTVPPGSIVGQDPAAGASVLAGSAVSLQVSSGPPVILPPDPSTVASAIDPTVVTDLATATAFLYTGTNPIQSFVAAGTIESRRAAIVRGKVLGTDGLPLPGVQVTVAGHPEYGQTLSRADGMYDLAVNGGGPLGVRFDKVGFPSAHRQVQVPWKDFAPVPDVILTAYDTAVTAISSAAATVQVARANPVTDADGARQSTLLFSPGTRLTMTMPDGTASTLENFHVRATEVTVGPNGPRAMPAMLPPSSAYTYAVELSVDEGVAAGASGLRFNVPVVNYLENFPGFPVGTPVPVGYFDRDKGAWVASQDGRVVKVLGVTGGLADLDTDGDGVADDATKLTALGVTAGELTKLAVLYQPGQTLWRVAVTHFSWWDFNWPWGFPGDAEAPLLSQNPKDPPANEPDLECHSVIDCQEQSLGESVAVTGTPWRLNYRSNRTPGKESTLNIALSGSTLPASLKRIDLEISVAGRQFFQSFGPTPNLSYGFVFDGKDAYGRTVQGPQPVRVRIGYTYPGTYMTPGQTAVAVLDSYVFGHFTYLGAPASANAQRFEATLWQVFDTRVGSWDMHGTGLGGWSLDVQHVYDPVLHTLVLGTGEQRVVDPLSSNIITTVAGNGVAGFSGDGGPATQASLAGPSAVAVGPDGSLYIASADCMYAPHCVIRRVGPDGTINAFAGNSWGGFAGDGGPATSAQISRVWGMAVGPDGTLYIADGDNQRIRHIDKNGIIKTVAGNGAWDPAGDGGPAIAASLHYPMGLAFGPDGSMYIADSQHGRVRRVGTDGIISTVAGGGTGSLGGTSGKSALATSLNIGWPLSVDFGPDGSLYIASGISILRVTPDGMATVVAGGNAQGFFGEGVPATTASLCGGDTMAVDRSGSVYIAEGIGCNRVRRVGPDGIITTIAGNPYAGNGGDGGPATAALLNYPGSVAIGPDGAVYIQDRNYSIRKVSSPVPVQSLTDLVVPSEHGREVYVFNARGRHLRTLDSLTGAVRLVFGYDAGGFLVSVTDGSGNFTTIERTGATASAIVAPGGQRTTLLSSSDGWLASASNPAGEAHTMSYSPTGLLQTFTDPLGNVHRFTYDSHGYLVRDDDPAGGSISLARTTLANGFRVTTTSTLGRTRSYQVEQLPTGTIRRTKTTPSGARTVMLVSPDGTKQTTYADGSTRTVAYGPDPRFGMMAPIPASVTLRTPAGLTRTVTTTQQVTLSNPTNLLSLTRLTETVTDNGAVSTSVFDAAGPQRTITGTTAAGRITTATLDALGRVTSVQGLGLDPVAFLRDTRGLLGTITGGSGLNSRTTLLTHDASYLLTAVTDALGRTTALSYDRGGRPLTDTGPDGSVITVVYDASGNMTSLTPPGRVAHRFGYTTIDQEASYTPPDLGSGSTATQYVYDSDRALTRKTRPDGLLLDLGYDTAGRIRTVLTASGQIGVSYDTNSDRLTGILAPSGVGLSYGYDGNLMTAETVSGPVAGAITWTYDANHRVTAERINGASNVTFAYDADGLLTSAGSLTLSRSAQNGLLTGSSLGLVTDSLGYDTLGEVINYSASFGASPIYGATYVRDAAGRITQKAENIGGSSATYSYGYDPAGRLISVSKDSVPIGAYSYDANGNRTATSGPGGSASASYDAQDRLRTYAAATYNYTANGELLTKTIGGQASGYQYDALGNLLRVTLPNGTVIDYLIDGKNRRIGKKVNGVFTRGLLYKGSLRPVAELDGGNAIVSRFVYGTHINVPDYMIAAGVTYRIITDHLGSPRLVVDVATGTVAQRIDYDEFGGVLNDTNPGFQPFGFAGGLYDRDTGLVRFGARDYDAEVGRWTAKDPIGFAGRDANLYAYAGNDPVGFTDRNGTNYTDVQVSIVLPFGAGVAFGAQRNDGDTWWNPYVGPGIGSPGVTVSVGRAEGGQTVTHGWSACLAANIKGAGDQVGLAPDGSPFFETSIAIGAPGVGAFATWVLNLHELWNQHVRANTPGGESLSSADIDAMTH